MELSIAQQRYIVYALKEPNSTEVRYIGQSTQGIQRPLSHFNDREHTEKTEWIGQSIQANGGLTDALLEQMIVIVTRCTNPTELNAEERKWISHYRNAGHRLFNKADGGNNTPKLRKTSSVAIKDQFGHVFKSIALASRSLMIPQNAITRVLNGSRRHTHGFRFYKEAAEIPEHEKNVWAMDLNHLAANAPQPIQDNTGRIYKSIGTAAKELKIDRERIRQILRGERASYRGLTFKLVDKP